MDLRKSLIIATAALSVATALPASAQRATDTAAKVEDVMRPPTSANPSDSLTGRYTLERTPQMIRETYESMSDPRMLVSDDSGNFLITIGSTPDDELTLKSALWWCEGQTGNACGIVSVNGVDVKNPEFKKRRTAK